MAQVNYSNIGDLQRNQQLTNMQFPYGNNNLIMNTPYDNYMGRPMQQTLPVQYLKCRPVSSKQEARADLLSTYGEEIIYITNKIFTKLENL